MSDLVHEQAEGSVLDLIRQLRSFRSGHHREVFELITAAAVALERSVGFPVRGQDRHLLDAPLSNHTRVTIVREDLHDAVTLWNEAGDPIAHGEAVHQEIGNGAWQPQHTMPRDGTAFYARHQSPFRFQPYKPTSEQARRGIKGRWQTMNEFGGWDNCHEPVGPWKTMPAAEPKAVSQ